MFSNLYPLSNTAFINLGRAQFLCDLITGITIDICAHIFQIIGRTTARSATRTCIPFCSLIMKIMLLEGVRPPTDGKIVSRPRPISMITLQASKSHSSKAPKSEQFTHATPSGHDSATLIVSTPFLPSLLSYRRPALCKNNLVLKLISWVLCLRVCICVLPDLKKFSTPPTIRSKCVSR